MASGPRAASRRITQSALTLAVAGAASLLGLSPAPSARADDLSTITSRVQSQLLSDAPSTSTVQSYMNSEQSNGSWSDISYSSTAQTNWSPGTHLSRMAAMAEVWANPKSSLYHSATLATDMRSAMDYWFSFTANASSAPGSADNYKNPTPYSTNWFDNDISGPQALGSAMVMASSVFTSSELSEAQNYLLNAKKEIPSFTGQNVVDLSIVGVYGAIASGNTANMTSAFTSMNGTVFVSNFGTDGIQADSSYHIHGIQLYMGGYGTSYINDMLNWASLSAGTSDALSATQEQTVVNYLLDGTQWFIRGQTLDLTADGRQVTFSSYVGAGDGYVTAIENALALGTYRTPELQAFLTRQEATLSSGAAGTQDALVGNRDFFDSDVMVQQRPAYYASVKVASNRTSDPETGNNQGLENLYLGDGVNEIEVTGNEYLGIQPSWNWRRLPGTTVEQDTRSLTPSGTFGAVKGTTSYAGGVSDGMYGAEAFNYSRFDVNAQKSWFFFDNEEVALGAGISSSNTTYEVDTTLNQCLLTSTVSYETSNGTIQTLSNGTVTPANLQWVYQGGVGYFFFTPVSNATIMAVAQTGKWSTLNTAESSANVTQNVFTLYIDHGAAVSNGSYSYIAVPGITAAGMDAYLASNPIQILRNDATVQAVRQSSLDLTQAAFYSAGNVTMVPGQTVAASAPSTIMLQRQPNVLKLSASSPQALQMSLQLSLSNVTLSGTNATWFDALGTATAGFNLPGGNTAGSTVGITLSSDGTPTPTISLISNDQSSNASYTVNAPVALPNNTTFQEDSFSTLIFAQPISGNAGVTKTGAGTLVLSAANSFIGDLNINAGTLRLTTPGASGAGFANVNPGGALVFTGSASYSGTLVLAGGTVGANGSPADIASTSVIAAPNTTSTILLADPQSPATASDVIFTGALHGSGTIDVVAAANTTNPDLGDGLRLRGTSASDFTGNLVVGNNVKAEIQTSVADPFSPLGNGTLVLTAGDHQAGGNLTLTSTGGYSEFNLRNNSSGNATFGNNVQIVGIGLTLLNPLGTAPANASVSMGNLQIGNAQTLGIFLNDGNAHLVNFASVTLTGGTATFAPKPQNFGSAGATGSDLALGPISQTAPTTITMAGLRTLYLTGNNTFTGGLDIASGIVQLQNPGALNAANPQPVTLGSAANSATLDLGGVSAAVGGLAITPGSTGPNIITNNGPSPSTLTFANGTSSFAGTLQNGSNTLAFALRSGTLTLTSPNSYTGGTTLSGGTLYLANTTGSATGSGPLILNGGTLIGTGTIAGTLLAGTGPHTIHPGPGGGGAGTLTVGGLTTNPNTTLAFDLSSPTGANALLQVAGNLTLNGGSLAIASQAASGPASLGYYKVLTYSGTLTGAAAGIALPPIVNNLAYTLDTTHTAGAIDIHLGFLGDANDDGAVDTTDLNLVLQNLGAKTTSWTAGNFDGAPTIDLNDLNDVLNNLGTSIPSTPTIAPFPTPPATTPEPASAAMLALGATELLIHRRKTRPAQKQ